MNKLAIVLALGASMASVPALAATGDVSGNVTVTGTVASKCQFTLASEAIVVPELAGADGTLDAATVNGQTKNLAGWCNKTASTMAVNATQLINSDVSALALQPGFVRAVTFTATADAYDFNDAAIAGGSTSDSNSADGLDGATPANVNMFHGKIKVTLSNAATATGLLSAGTYTGNVKVTLSPAV